MPDVSMPGESFLDTALVNGTAYPKLTVDPKAYRFRILNGSNDRFWNLQIYVADPKVVTKDGRRNTEVKMVPAVPNAGLPETWPTDGREGGVPDPRTRGPRWIQIGTEGGFLPATGDRQAASRSPGTRTRRPSTSATSTSTRCSSGTAERADVIVDFSQYAGKTLIVYNDAPAAFPALDPRYDYYTGSPDLSVRGWRQQRPWPVTARTRGPSCRSGVRATKPAKPFDLARLRGEFASTADDPRRLRPRAEPDHRRPVGLRLAPTTPPSRPSGRCGATRASRTTPCSSRPSTGDDARRCP